jgi:DNA-binding Lrp family transcriptional regulator
MVRGGGVGRVEQAGCGGYRQGMRTDDTDRHLVELLMENARLPAAALGRRLGLSRTTVQSRIERLERNGHILGYTVRTAGNPAPLVRAHVHITLAARQAPSIEASLRRLPQVRELHAVGGAVDLIAVLCADSTSEIDQVIDRIAGLDGVTRTNSMVLLSTRISR